MAFEAGTWSARRGVLPPSCDRRTAGTPRQCCCVAPGLLLGPLLLLKPWATPVPSFCCCPSTSGCHWGCLGDHMPLVPGGCGLAQTGSLCQGVSEFSGSAAEGGTALSQVAAWSPVGEAALGLVRSGWQGPGAAGEAPTGHSLPSLVALAPSSSEGLAGSQVRVLRTVAFQVGVGGLSLRHPSRWLHFWLGWEPL